MPCETPQAHPKALCHHVASKTHTRTPALLAGASSWEMGEGADTAACWAAWVLSSSSFLQNFSKSFQGRQCAWRGNLQTGREEQDRWILPSSPLFSSPFFRHHPSQISPAAYLGLPWAVPHQSPPSCLTAVDAGGRRGRGKGEGGRRLCGGWWCLVGRLSPRPAKTLPKDTQAAPTSLETYIINHFVAFTDKQFSFRGMMTNNDN